MKPGKIYRYASGIRMSQKRMARILKACVKLRVFPTSYMHGQCGKVEWCDIMFEIPEDKYDEFKEESGLELKKQGKIQLNSPGTERWVIR